MPVNVTVYDLDNYPDNSETVTVDHLTVVPVGYEGDEQWVLSFSTTAFSDNDNSTAIQDIYVREIKAGWAKSSGLVGTGGKFTISSGTGDKLNVKMDNSSQYYYITLDPGVNLGGDVIASDMQAKIRALPDAAQWQAADAGYALAYRNAVVDFTDGKFRIVSGSVGKYYTGTNRSSVKISKYSTDTLYETLGFDLGVDSETIAGNAPTEALVTSTYTAGTSPLTIAAGTGVQAGDALVITDGSNTDYFVALAGTTDTSVVVAVTGTNNYAGISNSYTADESKVQVLKMQDPESLPRAYYETVDAITRWGIMSVTNQIDFSG